MSKKSDDLFWANPHIWVPNRDILKKLPHQLPRDCVAINGHVLALLTDEATGEVRSFETENLISDNGDLYYAYRGDPNGSVIPTTLFTDGTFAGFDGIIEYFTGGSTLTKGMDRSGLGTPVSGSQSAMEAGYPLRDDQTAANTGKGTDVVSYKASYAAGVGTANTIATTCITNPTPGASENVLSAADFGATFNKEAGDTLDIYINHQMNGS